MAAILTWENNTFKSSGSTGYLTVISLSSTTLASCDLYVDKTLTLSNAAIYLNGGSNSYSSGISCNSITRACYSSASATKRYGIYYGSTLSLPSASSMAGCVIGARYYSNNMGISGTSIYRKDSGSATSSYSTNVGNVLFSDGVRWYAFEGNY